MKREKVLLTGGAGFIGSHIAELLLANDYEVVIIDDLSTGVRENINDKTRFYHKNINDPGLKEIFLSEKPDYVCHQAAQVSVPSSIKNPQLDAQTNIMGLLNLLNLSYENRIKGFIFASSGGAVYGEAESLPITEDTPFNPIFPYGISKMISEYYLQFYYNFYNLRYIALRYGNVYGPRQNISGETGVIANFIEKMVKGNIPIINGDGESVRDYIYVKDVAKACLLSIKNVLELSKLKDKKEINRISYAFNIGTGVGVSVNQLYLLLQEIIKFSQKPTYGPHRMGDLRKNILDCKLAKQTLGWEPQYNLKEGLKATVEWFKLNEIYRNRL